MRPDGEQADRNIAEFEALRQSLAPMAGLTVPWWVAGGWALDLFLNTVTRPHADVDVAVLRRDQGALRRHFAGWSLRWVEPWPGGAFRPWRDGEWLEPPVHEIHGANDAGATIELLLNESHGAAWHFRQNVSVQRPLAFVGRTSSLGIPYLAPEIDLLYKSEDARPSDHADFARVVGSLREEQRSWLSRAIGTIDGTHPWLAILTYASDQNSE